MYTLLSRKILLCCLTKESCYSLFFKKTKNPLKKFCNISNMANQTIIQKSTEQSQHIVASAPFQTLQDLPISLPCSQCVLYKHEILICGGYDRRACYSYHTLKNEYKFICEYPSDITLLGHCVVKLANKNKKDSNKITLLSFGGSHQHTLMMKYANVWNDDNKLKKLNHYNQWIPFTDNHNHPVHIEEDYNNFKGLSALIGGSNNHLLFIAYFIHNISVFDLNTFQFIKHDTLPIRDLIEYPCFVSNSENGQGQEIMKTNKKKNYEMLLFCKKGGLLIEYDEDNNNFQFHKLPVCKDIAPLSEYAYVRVNDTILFFGGYGQSASKSVHKYSIKEKKWITFKDMFVPLCNCFGILNEDNTYIHIVGGYHIKYSIFTHIKIKLSELIDPPQLVSFLFFLYLNT
ncbi:hypothetical protein RFI_03957 [Reticulomyxa filosa]|uniref:Kelch motif family protein n=1 Tax=Reticulomyxa filosa TaxID=46433 RepID=X6P4Z4_RETFI|nr:hypothetical protein RFI_03957 [Reticulomyxa filosa]|eukprot:ETO33154.1 hypothetical protein RFI_03957 [Reticulomyxa filosa]